MLKPEAYKMLSFFADNNAHPFAEIMNLATFSFKYKDWQTSEKLLTRHLLENQLVYRCWNEYTPRLDSYKLTAKGDTCFRDYQIWRIRCEDDNSDAKRYFKYFYRTADGRFGTDGTSRRISERDMLDPFTR